MGKYEVTNAQYAAFLNANSINGYGEGDVTYYENNSNPSVTRTCKFIKASWGNFDLGLHWESGKWVPVSGYENHPVINVSWFGAKAYADWVGGALPTEAQWEYACRAGTTTAFCSGNDVDELSYYAWFDGFESSMLSTKTVGQKDPNNWGLYDMHGNVREWCSDWYGDYGSANVTDPTGPENGGGRVLRGGSWGSYDLSCRSAYRSYFIPDHADYSIGFRVVFSP